MICFSCIMLMSGCALCVSFFVHQFVSDAVYLDLKYDDVLYFGDCW